MFKEMFNTRIRVQSNREFIVIEWYRVILLITLVWCIFPSKDFEQLGYLLNKQILSRLLLFFFNS